MAFPVLDPADLARRLGLSATDPATIAALTDTLAVAAAELDPRCDPAKVDLYPKAYLETAYQLAVKIWDTSTRGTVSDDLGGTFDLPNAATSGLFRSVIGVAHPILKQGGVIVG